ncbi:MAG: hypothetical protein H7289_03335 [Mucilaginibacter sp.]|nr:hypothetical protein [Mucilaginibacter sp.]
MHVNAFAQKQTTKQLDSWIKKKEYVQLADIAHLPASIAPYYKIITDTVFAHLPAVIDPYVNIAQVEDTPAYYQIIIYPFDELKRLRKFENDQREARLKGLDLMSVGGGDITLRLNKKIKKVSFYYDE